HRRDRGAAPPLAPPWFLAARRGDRTVLADIGLVYAHRSVGNALWRGRTRSFGARRLDLDLDAASAGNERLVLVEADIQHVDAGALDGRARRRIRARRHAERPALSSAR